MNNKRVLVFSHELPPEGGGAGVVGLQYCLELVKAGYEVTLLTKKKTTYPKSLENVNIVGVTYIPKLYLIPYYLKLKKMGLSNFNHIILNDMVSVYVAGFSFSKKELNKSISFLHGSEPEIVYKSPDIYQKLIRLTYFYNKAVNRVRNIVAVSDYMKNKFLDETPYQNADKIKVCHSKLGSDFFPMGDVSTKPKGLGNMDIILTVSRIERGKGFVEMYEVFKKLIELDSKFIWQIVGEGSFKEEFESIVKKDNLAKHISFIGKVERSSLKHYFESANVFWLLSNYKESFGLVYLEAASCYCPAIGYRRYGVVEAISDKKTGFLVDDKDECIALFFNRRYRSIDKSNFLPFVSKFNSSSVEDILNPDTYISCS